MQKCVSCNHNRTLPHSLTSPPSSLLLLHVDAKPPFSAQNPFRVGFHVNAGVSTGIPVLSAPPRHTHILLRLHAHTSSLSLSARSLAEWSKPDGFFNTFVASELPPPRLHTHTHTHKYTSPHTMCTHTHTQGTLPLPTHTLKWQGYRESDKVFLYSEVMPIHAYIHT